VRHAYRQTSKNFKNTRMNPAALPVLESVDTEWDRARAAKELLNTPCSSERGHDLHNGVAGANRGANWLG
jgi:hypothetical protein